MPKALEGVASGANSAFRELGGVLGIAVLGAVFSSHGGYSSGQDYVNGMTPAVYVGRRGGGHRSGDRHAGSRRAPVAPAQDALSLEGAGLAGEGAMVDGLTPIGTPIGVGSENGSVGGMDSGLEPALACTGVEPG